MSAINQVATVHAAPPQYGRTELGTLRVNTANGLRSPTPYPWETQSPSLQEKVRFELRNSFAVLTDQEDKRKDDEMVSMEEGRSSREPFREPISSSPSYRIAPIYTNQIIISLDIKYSTKSVSELLVNY